MRLDTKALSSLTFYALSPALVFASLTNTQLDGEEFLQIALFAFLAPMLPLRTPPLKGTEGRPTATRAIVTDMCETLPNIENLGPEALLDSMNSQRSLLEPIFEETSAMTSLFAFRDLSDEELEALVIFAESAAGRWYHGTTSSVFLETLRETTASLGDTFIVALLAQPPS